MRELLSYLRHYFIALTTKPLVMNPSITIEKISNNTFKFGLTNEDSSAMDLSPMNSFRYEWDFGDGKFSYEPNPVYSYPQAGKFKVSVKIHGGSNVAIAPDASQLEKEVTVWKAGNNQPKDEPVTIPRGGGHMEAEKDPVEEP